MKKAVLHLCVIGTQLIGWLVVVVLLLSFFGCSRTQDPDDWPFEKARLLTEAEEKTLVETAPHIPPLTEHDDPCQDRIMPEGCVGRSTGTECWVDCVEEILNQPLQESLLTRCASDLQEAVRIMLRVLTKPKCQRTPVPVDSWLCKDEKDTFYSYDPYPQRAADLATLKDIAARCAPEETTP